VGYTDTGLNKPAAPITLLKWFVKLLHVITHIYIAKITVLTNLRLKHLWQQGSVIWQ